MQMPEGFKRFEEWCQNFDSMRRPRESEVAQKFAFTLSIAAGHLKEMAEALEEMIEACDKGYARSMTPMKKVLEKFRNWK